ncbi:MAG: UvrD-helicase domain-containing protein, partial [Acidobacteriota bacterium]|nr:UvrD-helicase domain-containing protein [Acidobacteriota bacterium]
MIQQQLFDLTPRPRRVETPQTPQRRNLVIEAGAGTGKTTAIVAEVLKLMLDREDLSPERVVLMTFTEKAAGEIADRIRGALEELDAALSNEQRTTDNGQPAVSWPVASPNPLVVIDDADKARRAIRHHLTHVDALRSQTIHSFCQSLLRTFPIEAGLDPQFKIIEGFERSLLYGQVYDAWLDHETRVDPQPEFIAEWELLFAHAGYLFQIRELILNLLERRDLLGETEYEFGDYAEVREELLDAISAIRRCADDVGDEHARRIFAYVREATPRADTLDECIAYLQPIASSIREANLPRHGVLKEALRILRAGDKGRCIYDRLVSHRAAMALLALTRRFLDFLDAEKRKLGVVDFDDLLLRTLALLDDEHVLARARNQFDHIFVDEFQDTDRTQARIIDKLARDSANAFVPGKTIVVGDPKQSIYGFRRADPETYYRMTEELRDGGAERRVITDQYRSDPPLLATINAMFARLFPEETQHDPNVFRPAYHELRAARGASRRELDARITMLQAQHDDKSDRYFAEAEAVANWIEANRDGSDRDLQRFAILFRRLTKLDDYLDTLDRRGIPYVLPPTRMFLDRRAPVDLLAVLRAVAYPFDRGAQISAARTPYFALTDVEIAEGLTRVIPSEVEGSPASRVQGSPAERPDVAPWAGDPSPSSRLRMTRETAQDDTWSSFERTLASFRESSRHLTVSQLIDHIIATTNIERVYDAAVDGIRHLRHLEHVRAIAFEYDQRLGGSVRQFVDEITRRRDDPEEMEPSLADESQNAVRILSVHAAKGLEFETVILPDLAFPTTSSEATQLFTVESPRSLVLAGRAESISANFRLTSDGEKLKKLAGKRDEAELRRLFYVAVTRAKTDVVFVCNVSEETKNVGFFKCVTEALGVDRKELPSLWPESGRELRETEIGAVAFEVAPASAPQQTRTRKRLHDAALEATLANGGLVDLELQTPAPVTTTLSTSEIAARRSGNRNRAAGILLHRLLELWDGRGDADALLRQLATEAAADAETITRVRQRVASIARSPMLQRIARAETIGREVPVRFLENGTLVERRIDRLVREEAADLVIDYKSGAPDEARVARDQRQVRRYCRAIEKITGRPCAGAVWYIDSDT